MFWNGMKMLLKGTWIVVKWGVWTWLPVCAWCKHYYSSIIEQRHEEENVKYERRRRRKHDCVKSQPNHIQVCWHFARWINKWQKQISIMDCVSQCKPLMVKQSVTCCRDTKQNILEYLSFSIIHEFHPLSSAHIKWELTVLPNVCQRLAQYVQNLKNLLLTPASTILLHYFTTVLSRCNSDLSENDVLSLFQITS
jgi:hypothetical protein